MNSVRLLWRQTRQLNGNTSTDKMCPILRLLMITGVFGFGATTAVVAQQDYSIDDVLLLNRQFLDYLVAFNESILSSSELSTNQQCMTAVRQLAEAYLNQDRYGLECE